MTKELITQPSYTPTRKVGGGQLAGAVVTILSWLMLEFGGVELPLVVNLAILQIVIFAAQYYIKESS
jgi:high-affinity Fe2+/Pb2+ permease